MDTLQATPSNDTLMAIAAALRKARSVVSPTDPESFMATPRKFLADALLSEGGIGEIEDWAHGNYPVELQPGTGLPRFKSNAEGNRGTNVVDAVGMLPVGAAGKLATGAAGKLAAGVTIPIMRGMNASKGATADLVKAVQLAETMRAKGATTKDIWRAAKVEPTEGMEAAGKTDPLKGKWSHELIFPKNMFGKHVMNPYDKFDVLRSHNIPQEQLTTRAIEALVNLEAPKRGSYSLKDLELGDFAEQYPNLTNKLRLNAFEQNPGPSRYGNYFGGTASIFPPTLFGTDGKAGTRVLTPRGTAIHEIRHGVQDELGLPTGANAEVMELPDDTLGNFEDIAEELGVRAEYLMQGSSEDEGRKMLLLSQQLRNVAGKKPFERYESVLGEVTANTDALRDTWSPSMRELIPPSHTQKISPQHTIEYSAFDAAKAAANPKAGGDKSIEGRADRLLEILRRRDLWHYGP